MSDIFCPYKDRYFDVASLVTPDRLYILETLMFNSNRIEGDFVECGVYKGGTAKLALEIINESKKIFLFDTFSGMPEVNKAIDLHRKGDFSDSSLQIVKDYLCDGRAVFKPGLIPESFSEPEVESLKIAFAHVDVDIYQSVLDSFRFIYPRLSVGGVIVCDDYGFPTCPGAKMAVDEFCKSIGILPLVLPTGQAIVIKNA